MYHFIHNRNTKSNFKLHGMDGGVASIIVNLEIYIL